MLKSSIELCVKWQESTKEILKYHISQSESSSEKEITRFSFDINFNLNEESFNRALNAKKNDIITSLDSKIKFEQINDIIRTGSSLKVNLTKEIETIEKNIIKESLTWNEVYESKMKEVIQELEREKIKVKERENEEADRLASLVKDDEMDIEKEEKPDKSLLESNIKTFLAPKELPEKDKIIPSNLSTLDINQFRSFLRQTNNLIVSTPAMYELTDRLFKYEQWLYKSGHIINKIEDHSIFTTSKNKKTIIELGKKVKIEQVKELLDATESNCLICKINFIT